MRGREFKASEGLESTFYHWAFSTGVYFTIWTEKHWTGLNGSCVSGGLKFCAGSVCESRYYWGIACRGYVGICTAKNIQLWGQSSLFLAKQMEISFSSLLQNGLRSKDILNCQEYWQSTSQAICQICCVGTTFPHTSNYNSAFCKHTQGGCSLLKRSKHLQKASYNRKQDISR